jgi:O-antigen/teichoic acid export membrane protein
MPGAMRRLTKTLLLTLFLLALSAPAAFAQASGEGTYGETDDQVVTNAAFIVIIFFPLLVLVVSLLQYYLEKRKDAKKAAVKAAGGDKRWQGGW